MSPMRVSQRVKSTCKGHGGCLLLTACLQMLSYRHTMAAGAASPAAGAPAASVGEKQEEEEPAAIEEDGVAEEEGKMATPAAAEAGAALNEKLSQTTEVNMLDLQLAYLWRVHRVNYYVGGRLQVAAARGSRLLLERLSIRHGIPEPLFFFTGLLPCCISHVHTARPSCPPCHPGHLFLFHTIPAFHGWDCSEKHRLIWAPCVSCLQCTF